MNVLFLDVDGVLNTHDGGGLHWDKLKHLSRIVNETDCKIVLSSAWRYMGQVFYQCLKGVADRNDYHIISCAMFGCTPLDKDTVENRHTTILRWFENNSYQINSWVALDDLPCIKDLGENHSVLTDPKVGLTGLVADEVIRKLNNP